MNARSISARALAVAFFAASCQGAAAKDAAPVVVQEPAPAVVQEAAPVYETSFNDHDRQATRDWYRQNHTRLGAGWRQQDRLAPGLQIRLRAGQRLDPELRRHMHPLPSDLSRHYRPAPRGYHYAVIGGNVVMLDNADQVHDVFSLTLQVK
jgi:Ni/Co efflux regulator RcnB